MKQNQFARKKRQLGHLAEKLQYLVLYHTGDAAVQIEKLIVKIKNLLRELFHVVPHADLKKILGTAALLIGITFSYQTRAQSFAPPQENPFGLTSGYYWALPAFADLDGDGDTDLLVGEYYGSMLYFENTGSPTNPQFASPQANPFGLDSTNYIAIPAFADLDGDGDMDLLIGEDYGAMKYFENTGSPTNPQFAAPLINPFGLVATYSFAAPAFTDLDNDGDLDLLIGEYSGNLQYFQNIGSANNPQFAAPQANPFGLVSGYINAFPAFADLDNDGDMDLLHGEYYGNFKYFQNTGTALNPQFDSPLTNPFGLVPAYYLAFPAFADLDNDGDMDLLVGEYYGAMQYYENTTVIGISDLTRNRNVQIFPNPVTDVLNVKSEENIKTIEVTNILGEKLLVIENPGQQISLDKIGRGMLMVKITFTNGNCQVGKIQKL